MDATPRVTVVYADDDAQYRTRLLHVLLEDASIDVPAVVVDGDAALRAIRDLRPDVALLDVATPGLSGLDIAEAVQADGAGTTRVLLLCELPLASAARATAAVGNDGIVDRALPREEILALVRAAAGAPANVG